MKNVKTNSSNKLQTLNFVPLIYLILFISAKYLPHKLWAFSQLYVYPHWVSYIVYAVLVLSVYTPFTCFIGKYITKSIEFISRFKFIAYFLFSALCIYIIYKSYINLPFHGDSYAILHILNGSREGSSRHLIVENIYKLILYIFKFTNMKQWFLLSMFNILLAFINSFVLLGISKKISSSIEKRIITFIILFSSSCMLLFNHIEFYVVPMLLSSFAMYFLLSFFENRKSQILFVVFALLAASTHMLTIYLVGFVALFYFAQMNIKTYRFSIWIPTILASIVILISSIFSEHVRSFIFLIAYPAHMFSFDHISLVICYIIYAAPAILYIIYFNGQNAKSQYIKLFLSGTILSILITFLIKFDFGGNDWDLASLMLIPIPIFVALMLNSVAKKHIWSIAFTCLIFLSLTIFGASNYERLIARLEQLVLKQNTIRMQVYISEELRMGIIMNEIQDYPRAMDYFGRHIEEYPYDFRGYLNLAMIQAKVMHYDEALNTLETAIRRCPERDKLEEKYNAIKARKEEMDKKNQSSS